MGKKVGAFSEKEVKHLGTKQRATLEKEALRHMFNISDLDAIIQPTTMADRIGMSVAALARTVGLPPETLQRTKRARAPKTQERLREAFEIIRRVRDWAGGDIQAMAWYRAEPIPAFGGRTAEALVKEGKAYAVRDYLDAVANGSFA